MDQDLLEEVACVELNGIGKVLCLGRGNILHQEKHFGSGEPSIGYTTITYARYLGQVLRVLFGLARAQQ